MSGCCIVQCGARKDENRQQLSLHKFPKNEVLRRKLLEAIGEENINPRHKNWYVCSLHFDESCFNRTLDVIRLRGNSIPTVILTSNKRPNRESSVLVETSNNQKPSGPCTSTVMPLFQLPHHIVENVHEKSKKSTKSRIFSKLKQAYLQKYR